MGGGGSKKKDKGGGGGGKGGNPKGDKAAAPAKGSGNPEFDYVFKMLTVGDGGVGKSSLILRFTDDKFSETFIQSIGGDYKDKIVSVDDAKVKVQVWDTAGQERFRTITSSYYRGSHGILFIFDISNKDTFTSMERWIEEVDKYAMNNVRKILVGNKSDMSSQRAVTADDAKALASKVGIPYMETSAKDNVGVTEVFTNLAKTIKEIQERDA